MINDNVMEYAKMQNKKIMNPNKGMQTAESTRERLQNYIEIFESSLDEEHEIGFIFNGNITLKINKIGFYGQDIICFYGVNKENSQKMQLIQNISQINILLVELQKNKTEAKVQIGFVVSE